MNDKKTAPGTSVPNQSGLDKLLELYGCGEVKFAEPTCTRRHYYEPIYWPAGNLTIGSTALLPDDAQVTYTT